MKLLAAALAAALLIPAVAPLAAHAEDGIIRVTPNPMSPIAALTYVPAGYDLAFVSGATPGVQGQPKPVAPRPRPPTCSTRSPPCSRTRA